VRYLSVCSGIEAATVAWHPLGWEAFAYSEIEAFPAAVLAHHYPNTPNFGDMTKFKDWPAADGPRYKALGNSMAVPVMRWIGRRIDLVSAIPKLQRTAA
jgi:site-specific DNA-cytosine methylase